MLKTGPIIIVEDDADDRFLLQEVLNNINPGNEVIFFTDGAEALEYIQRDEVHPFLVLSDINMPKVNGYELRNAILNDKKMSKKCIPYLFYTNGVNNQLVHEAYGMSIQGLFQKPASIRELQQMMQVIVDYWKLCM